LWRTQRAQTAARQEVTVKEPQCDKNVADNVTSHGNLAPQSASVIMSPRSIDLQEMPSSRMRMHTHAHTEKEGVRRMQRVRQLEVI